jgi:hypothetical protein
MGMIVSVYRTDTGSHDCTNGGMTNSKTGVSKLCIINVDGPFKPTDDAPAASIEAGPFGLVRIVPATPRWERAGNRMFGGNFAYTSDSRFRRAVEEITGADFAGPVHIHDRFEG